MNDSVAAAAADFLAHQRALGRKYHTEEATLRLLLAFTSQHGVAGLRDLTPGLLDAFIASRPRTRARSFNHLVGVIGCFLDWTVAQQRLQASPLRTTRRRVTDQRIPFLFDTAQARRLLDAAAALPDNSRATGRGPAYHAIFALCYGLGLRAGEACGLRIGDIDDGRQLLVVRGGKFGKSRLVPHGPRIGELLARQAGRRGGGGEDPLFSFDTQNSVHPGSASQVFHRLRHSFAVGCLLRWYREGADPQARLFRLSTFMGHVDPVSTAVYLTITPQLLAQASRRFEAFAPPAWPEQTQ
jgi:integrase